MTPAVVTRPLAAALVGNPNTGKTTLFNALSGLSARTGNYPGVTVETKKGKMTCGGRPFDLIDLPGTYSLAARSPDEMVAVDVILGQHPGEARPDVVVSIVDASNLDRNLYLTSQVLDLGVPVVVALNMIDVAESHGVRVDVAALSRNLGVPVVPIQANRKQGLDRLRDAIAAAAEKHVPPERVPFPETFEREAESLRSAVGGEVAPFLVRRLLLDVGGYTEQRLAARHGDAVRGATEDARKRLALAGCGVPAVEARSRYGWIRKVTAGCVERPRARPVTWTDRIDRVLTHKVWGTLIFLVLMFLVFETIFVGAKPVMKGIDAGREALSKWVAGVMGPGAFTSLVADGVVKGVGGVVAFLPQILLLFGFIAVLEDCGYMARAAFLMDKLMSRCGLSGKSFIPLLSSAACAVPGILATRVIENRRDRLATMVVAPLMSCSARLPVYTLIIDTFLTEGHAWWVPGLTLFAMYGIGLVAAPLVALVLKRTLLRGETPAFVMEMPLYKRPGAGTVVRRVLEAGWMFVRRAGTVILATMVLLWALRYWPNADAEGRRYEDRIAEVKREAAARQAAVEKDAGLDEAGRKEQADALKSEADEVVNSLRAEWESGSMLGRAGRAIEPAVRPLGWDWRMGVAALASFPAREVVVSALGVVYGLGEVDSDDTKELGVALRRERVTVPAALSLMVFFALCCQCASTLAVIRRETGGWRWPAFTFTYMTVLAYVAALVVYQVGSRVG